MQTITKLQQQNDKLNAQINTLEKQKDTRTAASIVLGIVLIALLYRMFKRKRSGFTGKTH